MSDLVTRERALLLAALLCYFAGAIQGLAYLFSARRTGRGPLLAMILGGLAFQVAFGAARWSSQGSFPLGASRGESLLLLIFAVAVVALVLHATDRARAAPAFAMPVAVALFAGVFLSLDRPVEEPFRDPWIFGHIATAMLGYGAFVTAFAFGMMHLLLVRQLRSRRLSALAQRLPPIETLERSLASCLLLGVLLLATSLALGAAYAAGRIALSDWITDAKVLCSLLTWVYYASALAARYAGGVTGERLSRLAIGGLAGVVAIYLLTALVFAGGHPFR